MGQHIDHSAGVVIHAKPGEHVAQGLPVFTLFTNDESRLKAAHDKLVTGFTLGDHSEIVDWGNLITCRITSEGTS